MPPNAEPASSDSGGESSVLVAECELNAGMWRKEGEKQPQERMQFDKAGKEQRLGERTGLSPPSRAFLHTLASMKSKNK